MHSAAFASASQTYYGRPRWQKHLTLTNFLIFLNVAIFVADKLLPKPYLLAYGIKNNAMIRQRGQWWRLLTCSWLHGGVLHLFVRLHAGLCSLMLDCATWRSAIAAFCC